MFSNKPLYDVVGTKSFPLTVEGALKWTGRRNRLVFICVEVFIMLFNYIVGNIVGDSSRVLNCLITLPGMYIGFVNCVKRVHDIGSSMLIMSLLQVIGYVLVQVLLNDMANSMYALTSVVKIEVVAISIFGLVFLVYYAMLFFKSGIKGPNKYGPDPLGSAGDGTFIVPETKDVQTEKKETVNHNSNNIIKLDSCNQTEHVKKCTSCNEVYGMDLNFCKKCGSKLVVAIPKPVCKYCGWEVANNDYKFCVKCGKPLQEDSEQ